MARFSKQMYYQRALAGVLPSVGEGNPNKFPLGALLYDETAGFTYQLRLTVGASGVRKWGLLSTTGDVISTITTVTMTAALMTGMMLANYAGQAVTLPAATTVPIGAWYAITNINAGALTITGNPALTVAAVLSQGESAAFYSDGTSWQQVVNDPDT